MIVRKVKNNKMPKEYEKIRDNCTKKGGSLSFCKTKAAKIYNGVIRRRNPSMPKLSNKHKSK